MLKRSTRTEDPTPTAPTPSALREGIAKRAPAPAGSTYQTPRVDVLSLSCEISAYAPDEDGQPLF